MSSYDDTPQITALYQEQEQINQAIEMLSIGGTVPSFAVAPPAPIPGEAPVSMMGVTIYTIAPSLELLQAAFDALTARYAAISEELNALGVTDTPKPDGRKLKSGSVNESTSV